MKILRFKTNLKCQGCIANVTPYLNAEVGPGQWKVDLSVPERLLTVEAEILPEKISEALAKAGYKAELLSK
jgi:copper chaperone CopZ